MEKEKSRVRLIVERWADVLWLALASLVVVILLEKVTIEPMSQWFGAVWDTWNLFVVVGCVGLLVMAIFFVLYRMGGFRWNDLLILNEATLVNPPSWFAVVIVIVLYPIVSSWGGESQQAKILIWGWFYCGIIILWEILGFSRFYYLSYQNYKETKANNGQNEEGERQYKRFEDFTGEDIYNWAIEEEKPIESRTEDLFGTYVVVDHICEDLRKGRVSISLYGGYGSGKTSVLRTVKKEISDEQMIFVEISGWGYDEKHLNQYILKCVVRALARDVDCLSSVFMPQEYMGIVYEQSWGWLNFAKSFFKHEDADNLLRRINQILKRLNKRMVLIIEDIDRNSNRRVQQELYSLADKFKKQDRFSFIFTYGENYQDCHKHEPLTKITDKTELMSRVPTEIARSQVEKLKQYLVEKYGDDLIDTVQNLEDILFSILSSPRILKRVMKNCIIIWEKLHGEVYVNDLIYFYTIKECAPQLYDLLNVKHDANELIFSALNYNEIKQNVEESQVNQFENIIKELGLLATESGSPKNRNGYQLTYSPDHRQSVSKSFEEVDYFKRVVTGRFGSKEVKDQNVIQAICELNRTDISILTKLDLIDENSCKKIYRFSDRLEKNVFINDLINYFKYIRKTDKYRSFVYAYDPQTNDDVKSCKLMGISISIYRQSNEDYYQFLETELEIFLGSSLSCCMMILKDWLIINDDKNKDVSDEFIEELKKQSEDIELFVKTLMNGFFFQLLNGLFYLPPFSGKIDPAPWQDWFGERLIKASRISPEVVGYLSIPYLFEKERRSSEIVYFFSENKNGEWLYGYTRIKEIMKVISELKPDAIGEDSPLYEEINNDSNRQLIDFAIDYAKKWLRNDNKKQVKEGEGGIDLEDQS